MTAFLTTAEKNVDTNDEPISRNRPDIFESATALLAHEIKNPLGSMKLFFSLLEQDLENSREVLPSQIFDILGHIKHSMRTIDGVLTDALHFLVRDRLRIDVVNLRSLIEEQIALVRPRDQAAIIALETAGNPYVQGDDRALGQAISNLLINALEAIDEAGRIEIVCDGGEASYVRVCIEDNGPGVADHVRESLFSPYVTTKRNGNGFGLAVVKRIVENHGGKVTCTSTKGTTTMNLILPRIVAFDKEQKGAI
jgi:signal transduction histidine kinase